MSPTRILQSKPSNGAFLKIASLQLTLAAGLLVLLLSRQSGFELWIFGVLFLGVSLLGVYAVLSKEETHGGEWMEMELAMDRVQSDLRRQTEMLAKEREELATLMSAISDAILAVDFHGKPLFFNSHFALLFLGADRKKELKEPYLVEIFREPEVLTAFHGALNEGVPKEASLPLYAKGSQVPRFFTLSVAPLRREVGPVYGAVGIFHDVTELKRAEKIRIEFVANVSHELRTPLTAIKGYTDTLRQDVAERRFDDAGKFLEIVARNVERLMSLIGDLLDLSSLESQDRSGELTKSPIDTRELTDRVMSQLQSRLGVLGNRVSATFGAATVLGDSRRIEQVLANLLENAIKYVPAEGKISIEWQNDGDSVLLRVADTGPGIPAEHLPRLFERFYRVDEARSRQMGGTGLGLAIVKHIMQRHGGSVAVQSEVGKGSVFICRFPTK